LFLPFVLGMLGIIFGWAGIKGEVRISLLFINSLALIFYLFAFLIGTFGFKQPFLGKVTVCLPVSLISSISDTTILNKNRAEIHGLKQCKE